MFQVKNNKQVGSVLVVVAIILAVLVAGSLSYVYFFMGKPTDENQGKDDEIAVVDDNEDDDNDPEPTPAEPADEPSSDEPDDSSETVSLNTKTGKENMAITQWGLIGYYNGQYDLNYYISNSTSGSKLLKFSSTNLTGPCEDAVVGSIMRLTGDMEEGDIFPSREPTSKTIAQAYINNSIGEWSGNWHIGDYYYVYVAPQTSCYQTGITTPDQIFTQVSLAVKNYFDTLVTE